MTPPPVAPSALPPGGGAASGPAEPDPRRLHGGGVPASELNRLRWRSRRGLLENDLFLERFFERCAGAVTPNQASGLEALMELPDNDLLDLLLRRTEPQGELARDDVAEALAELRLPPRRPVAAIGPGAAASPGRGDVPETFPHFKERP